MNFSRAVPPRNFIAETITAPGDSLIISDFAFSNEYNTDCHNKVFAELFKRSFYMLDLMSLK